MKRLLPLVLLLLASAFEASAQYTQATAQVKDSNGSLYANCSYSVAFVGQSSSPGPYTLGSPTASFQQTYGGAKCDSSGNLSIRLPDNNVIQPQPSQWKFSICSAQGYVAGPYCFNALVTITGASQDITSSLQSAAPSLPITSLSDFLALNNNFTGANTHAGTETFTGPTTTASLNNYVLVDCVKYSCSPDIAVGINAAIAALPTVVDDHSSGNSYAAGFIYLPCGTYTQATQVSITSPFIHIIGCGALVTKIQCTLNGTCWKWHTSPVTATPAGGMAGLELEGQFGSSGANSIGIDYGDIYAFHLRDFFVFGFQGTNSIGVYVNNTNSGSLGTERMNWWNVNISANTTCVTMQNNIAVQSFGYATFQNVLIQPDGGQTGINLAGGADAAHAANLYHASGTIYIENNGGNKTSTNKWLVLGTFSQIDRGSLSILMEDNTTQQTGSTSISMGNSSSIQAIQIDAICGANYTESYGTSVSLGLLSGSTLCSTPDVNMSTITLPNGSNFGYGARWVNPLLATNAPLSQSAPPIQWISNVWNGSASIRDTIALQPNAGNATNPNVFLHITHSGSSGLFGFESPVFLLDAGSGGGSARLDFPTGSDFPAVHVADATGTIGPATLTLKKGSGSGNYTNATTSYTVADSTNLCYTVTIPTGWKLGISASGALATATAAVVAQAALTDNAACSTANAGILVETAPIQGAGISIADAFALDWVITGDGNAHNIALQFKTSNASDTASLINSSATQTPTIKFELMPSN